MSRRLSIDTGKQTFHGILHPGIGKTFGGHIYEGYIGRKIRRYQMAVETVGLAYHATHTHTIYGMAETFLGNRDQKLRTRHSAPVVDSPCHAQRIAKSRPHGGIIATEKAGDSDLAAKFFFLVKSIHRRESGIIQKLRDQLHIGHDPIS